MPKFKEYCQKNLSEKLIHFEQKRYRAIYQVTAASVILPILLYFWVSFSYWLISESFCLPNIYELVTGERTARSASICDPIQLEMLSGFLSFSILILAVLIFAWVYLINISIAKYEHQFRSLVIQHIVNFVDVNRTLTYKPKASLQDKKTVIVSLKKSRLFNKQIKSPEFISESDCVYGKINDVKVCWSNVCIWEPATYDILGLSNNLENLIWKLGIETNSFRTIASIFLDLAKLINILMIPFAIIVAIYSRNMVLPLIASSLNISQKKSSFRGLIYEARFPKKINGTILIVNNKQQNNSLIIQDNLVKLEAPEFNRRFRVYSSDQVEARYILSTSLMERLIRFNKRVRHNLRLSFREETISIAIEYRHDLFQPRLFKTMLSIRPLQEYLNNIQLMIDIVEDLKLNRKIWI